MRELGVKNEIYKSLEKNKEVSTHYISLQKEVYKSQKEVWTFGKGYKNYSNIAMLKLRKSNMPLI